MFLAHLFIVVSANFWISLLVSELLFTTPAERELPLPLRIGFGHLLQLVWFAASWVLWPMGWCWIAGAGMITGFTLSRPKSEIADILKRLAQFRTPFLKTFLLFLLLANFFLIPLHISGNYGPFTEGGGDITAYADITKYLTDRGLPVHGFGDLKKDLKRFLKEPSTLSYNMDPGGVAALEGSQDNPPAAGYQVHRLATIQMHPAAVFAPFGQWFFLSGKTNYANFFGVMAFQYTCLLLAMGCFFWRFGRVPAALSVLIPAASQGLVSVAYNGFYFQFACMMISALMINLLPRLNLFSGPGFKLYGLGLLVTFGGYVHYMAVLLPLVGTAALLDGGGIVARFRDIRNSLSSRRRNLGRKWVILRGFLLALFFSVLLLGILAHLNYAVFFISNVSRTDITRLGHPVVLFGWEWFSFLFGFLSQQHLPPYVHPIAFLTWITPVSILTGGLILLSGFVVWKIRFSRWAPEGEKKKLYFWIYLAAILTILLHLLPTQGSLYTQAKGSQNVLVLFYLVLILPFAVIYSAFIQKKFAKRLITFLGIPLVVFGVTLLAPRIIFSWELAHGMERSNILEASYFEEAFRIIKEDPQAFVLFEPRNSADLYLGIQPFFGAKMIPTRHLVLTRIPFPIRPEGLKRVGDLPFETSIASDFIQAKDLSHLWTLSASKISGARSCLAADSFFRYAWKARKITDSAKPTVLLFGDNYDAFYSRQPQFAVAGDTGWFSYLRNGAAILYLPPGPSRNVEVIIQPVRDSGMEEMRLELQSYLAKALGDCAVGFHEKNDSLILSFRLAPCPKPQLIPILRYRGECRLNVRIDHGEIPLLN